MLIAMIFRVLTLGLLTALLGIVVIHHVSAPTVVFSDCEYGDRHLENRAPVERTLVNQSASIVDIRAETLRGLLNHPFELWTALGVGPNDRIVSINGTRSESCLSSVPFVTAIAPAEGPSTLDLEIDRGGERVRILVVVHHLG